MESKGQNDFSDCFEANQTNAVNNSDKALDSNDNLIDSSMNSNYYNIKCDFNSNDVTIYESNTDESFISDNSYDKNIDVFNVNDYENKIQRLSEENSKLSQQLIGSEEQIIDLINDKQNLQKCLKTQKNSFQHKIDLFVNSIEDLKQNIQSLETLNQKFEEKVNQKIKENKDLKKSFEDIEEKLLLTEYLLSEANQIQSDLGLSLNVTEEALNAEKCLNHETIERLNDLHLDCVDRDRHIIELKSQMDSLKQQISDKDNELWFHRSGDRTSIGHDFGLDTKRASNTSSSVNRKSKSSDKTSAMTSNAANIYEKLSDFNKKDEFCYENKSIVEDIESVVHSEEATKPLDSSTKSSIFPSLPDVILRKLQLLRENCCSLESLTEQEIESKFTTLSLAFKTDKLTLEQRLNLQKHRRDVAELNATNELQSLRESVQELNQLIFSFDDYIITNMRSEIKDIINKIETQVEVVGQTSAKISSRAELYGAVKQEERINSAFDVILLHSENMKKDRERDRKELERTKKLLTSGHKKIDFESDSDNESVPLRRSIRSISTTVIPKMNLIRIRRSSVSSIEILPNSDSNRKTIHSNSSTRYVSSIPNYLSNRSRRCSMPASPTLYRARVGAEELSHLEITAEERCGSDSDCSSSVANQESDVEGSAKTLHKRLSTDLNSSLGCEQNNNTTNAVNNNNNTNSETNETFNEILNQNSDESNDNNSSDNNSDFNDIEFNYSNESHVNNRLINILEFQCLVNLFNSFDIRIGGYVRRIVKDLRFIFAIILLITSLVIIIGSLIPISLPSLPCHCHCDSWSQYFSYNTPSPNQRVDSKV